MTIRKLNFILSLYGRRKNLIFLLPLLVLPLLWYPNLWLSLIFKRTPLPYQERNFEHFRRSRSLANYINNTQVLIHPSKTPCVNAEQVPFVILVASAPEHLDLRQAIRQTWAGFQPTYFVMGLSRNDLAKLLIANINESDRFDDIIVFDFYDHYQNLTIKTALMMYWAMKHCPQAQFMLKTDDKALVNPWVLNSMLDRMQDAKFLLGYKYINKEVERNENHKGYMPRWLYRMDIVPQYLDECGYLISVKDLPKLLKTANEVALVNLENIYFTYMVATKSLGLVLRHDRSICPKRPWLRHVCVYWNRALTHGYSPEEMISAWLNLESARATNKTQCENSFFDKDLFLH